jgi:hypothetical protein
LGEDVRQKILIHQVFNRSVKVWVRCDVLFHPHVPCPLSDLETSFSWNNILPWKKILSKDGEIKGNYSPGTLAPGLEPVLFSRLSIKSLLKSAVEK